MKLWITEIKRKKLRNNMSKLRKMKNALFTALSLFFCVNTLFSQSSPSYTVFTNNLSGAALTTGANITFATTSKVLTAGYSVLRQKSASANLNLKLDLGNDYVRKEASWSFTVDVNLSYPIGSE